MILINSDLLFFFFIYFSRRKKNPDFYTFENNLKQWGSEELKRFNSKIQFNNSLVSMKKKQILLSCWGEVKTLCVCLCTTESSCLAPPSGNSL